MPQSYDVRIWKCEVYQGARTVTHTIRWAVAGNRFREPFKTAALADSFRSELMTATRKGEAFDCETGRPSSTARALAAVSWYEFSCDYVDMKWPEAAGKSRAGIADTLATVAPAMLTTGRGRPDDRALRRALYTWAYNSRARASGPPDDALASAARWVERHSRPVADLTRPETVRSIVTAVGKKMDGTAAAPSTIARKRAVLHNALAYAVERKYLVAHPLTVVAIRRNQNAEEVDRRSVVNHGQARALLAAVAAQGDTGQRLVAFFGTLYYAGLRPGEAVALDRGSLRLPAEGWGELHLPGSSPTTGAAWGNSGRRRDPRGLKHRARNAVRVVPCAPPLTALLHDHLRRFGTRPDGVLFRGARGGDVSESTYGRVWQRARAEVMDADEVASPLARRPYDLRHAAVSTWLSGGVEPTRVAEWAGHSVAVLLRVYASCIAGRDELARDRVSAALGLG